MYRTVSSLYSGVVAGLATVCLLIAIVLAMSLFATLLQPKPYVPCETDNVEQVVYYGRDGDSRLVCWVTEWDEETGVNWVMKFEVIEEEPSE